MKKGRLEAFSDAVFAIIITIMVLDIDPPEDTDSFKALVRIIPVFISYLLSFVYIGIYWNNHHHIMNITEKVNNRILWANLNLLFWISLIPFATSWADENYHAPVPVAVYGIILLLCAISFRLLELTLIKYHGENFPLRKAIRRGRKEKISICIYIISVISSYLSTVLSIAGYVAVALLWFWPSKELENISSE